MYKLLPGLEKSLQHLPGFWKRLETNRPLPELDEAGLKEHVVIIGYGRVGKHLVDVLVSLKIPLLVIESDVEQVEKLNERQIPTLYGDAANSEVIHHAHLEHARALVSTVPDESTSALIVAAAKDIHPNLALIARASTARGVYALSEMGADHVVHPELEGGLELVHHTLLQLGFPLRKVHEYAEAVRRDHYNIDITTDAEHRSLHDLLIAFEGIEIAWVELGEQSPLVAHSLAETNIRSRTGASVVALIRNERLVANPKSQTVFEPGDRIGFIGESEQIEAAQVLAAG